MLYIHFAHCAMFSKEEYKHMYDKVKYNNEYNKQTYDRLNIQVPKGQKAVIEEHWRSKGYKSLNAYVNDLINKDMNRTEEGNKTVNIGRDNNGTISI